MLTPWLINTYMGQLVIDYYDNENNILGSGSNVDDLTISKEELGVYGFLQYELADKVFVNGGTRYHQADYAFSQRNVAVDEKQSPDEWYSTANFPGFGLVPGLNLGLKQQTGI